MVDTACQKEVMATGKKEKLWPFLCFSLKTSQTCKFIINLKMKILCNYFLKVIIPTELSRL